MNAKPQIQARELLIDSLSVNYGDFTAVDQVSLGLFPGEIGCLLGPSGCGKSTLLRSIAGFEKPSHGSIAIDQQQLANKNHSVAPEQRNIGMVFQDIALFPHLSVAENIAFGIKHYNKPERQQRIASLLELVGLVDYGDRYPHALSGGQQQRIALARAMAPSPQLLLLDEPFSGLDAALRERLVPQVRRLLKAFGITAIMVSHDQAEAFAMGDKIGVMNAGRLEQWDSAEQIFQRPASPFVAEFIGQGTLLKAAAVDGQTLDCALGKVTISHKDAPPNGKQLQLLIRPDQLTPDSQGPLSATLSDITYRGAHYLYHLTLDSGEKLQCHAPLGADHLIGEPLQLKLLAEQPVVFSTP